MDNIADMLSSLSEEDVQKLSTMAQELFGNEQNSQNAAAEEPAFDLSKLNVAALSSLAIPKEDERTRLIKALKPMLGSERQERADRAVKLLQLVALLPQLKESGLLDQFLG
ncbi:MAG: hypothetical protein IJJ41_06595 [Clostridia bacterium]|nr:hypothetical protein [Clostridia bacterium]